MPDFYFYESSKPLGANNAFGNCCFSYKFSSATQDIVIDAYREALTDEELGLGSSLYVNGYRVAIILSGAMALAMARVYALVRRVYQIMALMMGSRVVFLASSTEDQAAEHAPTSMKEAVIGFPFMEYLKRKDAITTTHIIL